MATMGERLATIEASLTELRKDVRELRNEFEGGEGVSWERSVRGRLHHIEGSLAATVLRKAVGLGMLKGWQAGLLVVCAVGTAAAAWYSALHR